MKIDTDKLLRYHWGNEIIDDTWGLSLCKTFREKEYCVIMKLLKKKVMVMEDKRQSQGLKELTKFFRNIEYEGLSNMSTLQYLEEGNIFYKEDDGYPSREVDDNKTKSSIMDCVEEEV